MTGNAKIELYVGIKIFCLYPREPSHHQSGTIRAPPVISRELQDTYNQLKAIALDVGDGESSYSDERGLPAKLHKLQRQVQEMKYTAADREAKNAAASF